ncbi:MAG TPA: GNAT family N-acetyltransferase [Acidimicrobiia bacterium]
MVTVASPSSQKPAALEFSDSEWDRLALLTAAPPFSRPGWIRPWSAMAGRRLKVVRVGSGEHPAGLIPMVARGGGLASAADWHVPMLEAIAVDDRAMASLAAAAIDGRRRVTIDFCDSGGRTAATFRRELATRGFSVRERCRMESPFVDLVAGHDSYAAGLGAKKLRELGRRRRRLGAEGRVSVGVSDGSTDLDRALSEGFAIEGSGWKGAAGTAIRSRRRTERFYREVANWASAEGMLCLSFLRIDGLAIAFDMAIAANGREWLLKTGYAPAWAKYAPGSLLRAAAIERAFEQGLVAYEFAGSADPWKLEWTSTCRQIVTIDGFAPGPAGGALQVGSRVARRLRVIGTKEVSWS